MSSVTTFGSFLSLSIADRIAVVTFDRPPVNAVDIETYRGLRALTAHVAARHDAHVMLLTTSESSTTWCGGADVNDFVGIDKAGRTARYEEVTAALSALHDLPIPVVAAITGPAVGVGVLIAAVCDLRVCAGDAHFACPEVDYGLVAGSARLLNYLGVPEALIREMHYTGARIGAERLERCGFLNRVVPRPEVVPTATALAEAIAAKGLPILRARKATFAGHQELGWVDAYRLAQRASADLVELDESRAGVDAFLGRG